MKIDSHDVQFYYAALLADENNMRLVYETIDDQNIVLFALAKK
ncbi:histidine phosphotransferase family protein [Candidatus Liberibacter africanus]|nr:histidine phosphotransferase family protein [Candidatus Liberibacter africanus]